MDRITRRIGETIDFVDRKGYATLPHKEGVRPLFEKLAEYEDIELTPKEIKLFLSDFGITVTKRNRELIKERQENKEIINKMAKRLKSFEENAFDREEKMNELQDILDKYTLTTREIKIKNKAREETEKLHKLYRNAVIELAEKDQLILELTQENKAYKNTIEKWRLQDESK